MSSDNKSQLLYSGAQTVQVDAPHGMITDKALQFCHVHDCAASHEERPCQFDWAGHEESANCACGPVVDETNLTLNGTVFIMHRGVC